MGEPGGGAPSARPRVAILYHYMYPDDVVSAHHCDELAQEFASRGWDVEAVPCNRGCRDETRVYPREERHLGVRYRRVWRPRFRQGSFAGRLANSAWMIAAWTGIAFRRRARRPDVVVIGTDPMFGVLAAIPLRLFARRLRIAHWCFDMHPEAALASGMVGSRSALVRIVRAGMAMAYRRCDLIADLGTCMRARLRTYSHGAREIELTPWALVEPERPVPCDPDVRRELFGDARLGLLYSGNFGEAHGFDEILALARALRDEPAIRFCFAVRGNRADALRSAIGPDDVNVSFAGFAPLEQVEKRLGAADIHLAALRPEWSGIAVPSKFFGSLASGRPVVFAGSPDCAIAHWIGRDRTGWVLTPETVPDIAAELRALTAAPGRLTEMQTRCHQVYREHFSRAVVGGKWVCELRELLGGSGREPHPETHGISASANRLPRNWRTACVLVEAAWELARARVYTLLAPSHCFRSLGELEMADKPGHAVDERLGIEIGRIVAAGARFMPFRALCLQQAIAVRRMLTRRGVPVVIHLGVSVKEAPHTAHAWVTAGHSIISGDTDLSPYVVVGRFS